MTSKKNILIIDDDPRNIFALKAVLHSRSFDCQSVLSAEEGLKILQGNDHFDAVLLDMMMPDMDGYEALTEIRKIETRKSIFIIAVTAQAMVGDRQKCLDKGADGYISKPIDIDKLTALLQLH